MASTYIISFGPHASSEVALLWLCPFLEETFRNHKMAELALDRCSPEETTPSVKEAADANKGK